MGLIFDGKSSRDYGLIISAHPSMNHGAKRGEAYTIAGRNGTFFAEDGTFDNYIQAYEVAILEKYRGASNRAADVAAWLLGSHGFCRLEDTFEPEFFKMARFAGPLNIEQILGKWGRCTIEFDCLPERWFKSGEEAIGSPTETLGRVFINPTPFTAKPLIKLYGTGQINVTVNGFNYMDVPGIGSSGPVIIDCDAGTVTDPAGDNLLPSVTFYGAYNEFPVFKPGTNYITMLQHGSGYEVVPRWWTL